MKNTFISFLILIFLYLFFFCTSPTKSKPKTKVTVQNISLTDGIDADGDNYYSYLHLNFDLDVNKSSYEVFVRLGIRVYGVADTTSYLVYLESDDFIIEGTGSADAKYISIGLPNAEPPQGCYDFLLRVFSPDNRDQAIAEASTSTHPDLSNIYLETSTEDIGIIVYDASWFDDSYIDIDGDGYYSQATLAIDVDFTGGTTDVYFKIYSKKTSESAYDLQLTSESYTITDFNSDDIVYFTFTNFTHDAYDIMFEVLYENESEVQLSYDKSDNGILGNVLLENSAQDIILSSIWLSYHDNIFENSYWINASYSGFAVRFDQPNNATVCILKKIKIHYAGAVGGQNYISIYSWDNLNNYPNYVLYHRSILGLPEIGWNEYSVDLDITDYDPFYAGYQQVRQYGPYLSADESSYITNRNYYRVGSTGAWIRDTDGDYAIEVLVEYSTSSQQSTLTKKSTWLKPALDYYQYKNISNNKSSRKLSLKSNIR